MIKYYKKVAVEKDFTQPILTSNGTLGGDNFAVYCNTSVADYQKNHPAWKAFDGNPNTDCTMGVYNYEHIIMYNPVPIKVSSLSSTRKSTASNEYYKFSASNDNATWVTLLGETNSGSTVNFKWNFPNNNTYYKYFKFEGKNVNGGSVNVYEMKLEGKIKPYQWQECTKAEYDQLPDDERKIVTDNYTIDTPKYLKKTITETAWTQPILKSNGTLGGNSFAVGYDNADSSNPAYYAVDNSDSTATHFWKSTNGLVGYIFYNPVPIKVTNIEIKNNSTYPACSITSGTVYGSNDGTIWTTVKSFTNSVITVNSTWNIDLSSNTSVYKYYKLGNLFVPGAFDGGNYSVDIVNMVITATQKVETWTAGTPADYDVIVPQVHSINTPKYLKKVNTIVESSWTQPILTSNGTLGGNSFAVQSASNTSGSYHAWQAFDGNVNTWWISENPNADYYVYNPVPLRITNIYVNGGSYYYEGRFNKLVVFGSNDNSNYTLIDTIQTTLQSTYNLQIKNNKGYKYYKFNFQNTNNPFPGYISIKEITLTATQLIGGTSWQECTKAEYDQLPDDQKHIENVNYIVKVA